MTSHRAAIRGGPWHTTLCDLCEQPIDSPYGSEAVRLRDGGTYTPSTIELTFHRRCWLDVRGHFLSGRAQEEREAADALRRAARSWTDRALDWLLRG